MPWLPLLAFDAGVVVRGETVPSFVVWIVVAAVSCLVNDDMCCWLGLLIVLIEERQLQTTLCLNIVVDVDVAVAGNFAGMGRNIEH